MSENTFKCKFCDSDEDLHWEQPYKKGNKPVRALDGKAHDCKKNKKKPEISATTSPTKKYDRNKQRSYDKNLPYKIGDLATPESPTYDLCGRCNNGTLLEVCSNEKCAWCLKKLRCFCPKCGGHPAVTLVGNSPESRLKIAGNELLPHREITNPNEELMKKFSK